MKVIAVHTCPLWEERDGTRRVGIAPEPNHPPVVGWCNVMELILRGERHRVLLTLKAAS